MKKITKEKQNKILPGFTGKVFSNGNMKLPKSTIICNLSSAINCPARRLGQCKVGRYCYAWRAEKRWPNCRNKNLAIENWVNEAAEDDIYDLLEAYIEDYEN